MILILIGIALVALGAVAYFKLVPQGATKSAAGNARSSGDPVLDRALKTLRACRDGDFGNYEWLDELIGRRPEFISKLGMKVNEHRMLGQRYVQWQAEQATRKVGSYNPR